MFDEELEKGLLYYIIFENEQYAVDENDFINDKHKKIIKAINELKSEKQEVSVLNINAKIKQKGVLEYLANLSEYIIGSTADEVYNKVVEYSKKRKMFNLLQECSKEIRDSENIDILINQTVKDLNKVTEINEKEKTFLEQVIETVDNIEKTISVKEDYKLYTGITNLDDIICGLHNEELTIIGARPGVGKTTFALQVAEKIAEKGTEVLIVSLEMSETQIIQKMLSKLTSVNSYKFRTKTVTAEDLSKIGMASAQIANLPIHLFSRLRTIQQIESTIRKLKNKNNIGLVVIDYIQLIKNKGKFNSREQEVADITRTLKLLSLELKIPIVGLCQLNRNATREEPSLADLRESGAIEQDADNVIFLYQEQPSEEDIVETTIKVAKQRAGSIGKVRVKFIKRLSEFKNIIY